MWVKREYNRIVALLPLGFYEPGGGRMFRTSFIPGVCPKRRLDCLVMHRTEEPDWPAGTVERWALEFVQAEQLDLKLNPPAPPERWMAPPPRPTRIGRPGRPAEFDLVQKTRRSIKQHQLVNPRWRAHLLHTFLHHELQAAELMAWAILAFPDSPPAFRQGLLGICRDELRHLHLYRVHIERLGHRVGEFPVRDWFWQRVQTCETPLQFVAFMGLGLEAANLDHTRRFAQWFREVGDEAGAALQDLVGDEEVGHVNFAVRWFSEWSGGVPFEAWRRALVEPLTPTMFRGPEIDEERRRAAGLTEDFLLALREWDSR